MSLENILVDEFRILQKGDKYAIAFQLDDGAVNEADFMYDGRNCAILVRNKVKAYLLTNILPNLRQELLKQDDLMIFEERGAEVVNKYQVQVRHVKEIPYPDNFEKDSIKMMEDLKTELGEEKYNELVKAIEEEYNKK